MIKSRRMKLGREEQTWERCEIYNFWVEKPEGKRSLEKIFHRWENNIKMCLKEVR
jgi:hypothetical protein